MIVNNMVAYKIHGLNFNKFLKLLQESKIEIFNLKKLEDNNFCLGIKLKDENIFKKCLVLCNMNVLYSELKSKDLKLLSFLKKNLAYTICSIILFLGIAFSNFFVFKIEIYGLETIQQCSIEKVLKENNFNVLKLKSSYNLSSLQTIIKKNFENISLASCTILGNTLVVNILEKPISNIKNNKPIVAPYNLIISDISLKSGTCLVSPNQVVKEGSELISPYITYKNGSKLEVSAEAEISAYAEKTISTIYTEKHYKTVRSGKKEVFNNIKFLNTNKNYVCTYKNFEVEKRESYLLNNFIIPIKKEEIIFYELIQKMFFEPFNENIKEKLIEENKNLLYNTFDSCKKVENKNFSSKVEKVENYYIISTTISANIIF